MYCSFNWDNRRFDDLLHGWEHVFGGNYESQVAVAKKCSLVLLPEKQIQKQPYELGVEKSKWRDAEQDKNIEREVQQLQACFNSYLIELFDIVVMI